jgi:hypothetical protein
MHLSRAVMRIDRAIPGPILLVGFAIAVWAPLLLADIPPLLDYPNHLARAVALNASGTELPAAQFYEARWGLVPNLGGDIVLLALLQFLPPIAAGRVLLALVLMVMVGGVILYARVAFGRWTAWSLASVVAAYNGMFLMGLLNMSLGYGLALALAALWNAMRQVRPLAAIGVTALGLCVVWFCHITGVILALVLIASSELVWAVKRRPPLRELVPTVQRRLLPLVLISLPIGLLQLMAPVSLTQNKLSWLWNWKFLRFFLPVAGYYSVVDLTVWTILVGILVFFALTRRLEVDWAGAVALFTCLILFIIAPWQAMGVVYVDSRFVTMACFLVFACLAPQFEGTVGRIVAAIGGAAVLLKVGSIGVAWTRAAPEIAQVRDALAGVPPRSLVLVATARPWGPSEIRKGPAQRRLAILYQPVYTHLGALALIDRGSFWPSMFDERGVQPIAVRSPYNAMTRQIVVPPSLKSLLGPGGALTSCAAEFDYILLMESSGLATPLPSSLQVERNTGFAMLLRVVRPPNGSTISPTMATKSRC